MPEPAAVTDLAPAVIARAQELAGQLPGPQPAFMWAWAIIREAVELLNPTTSMEQGRAIALDAAAWSLLALSAVQTRLNELAEPQAPKLIIPGVDVDEVRRKLNNGGPGG